MAASAVTEHVHRVSLGMVNVFIIETAEGMTLIDAGYRRSWPRIAEGIRGLGRGIAPVTDILVTHLHADHTGGLARAQEVTGARVWMHAAEAALIREGNASRPWKHAPGSLLGMIAQPFAGGGHASVAPVRVICEVSGGENIPVAGGITAVWTPGHTEGHISYLWPGDGGVLFVGDAAARMIRLRPGPIYEDYERGLESLRLVSQLDFNTACFSHGRPLVGGARRAFQKAWPAL